MQQVTDNIYALGSRGHNFYVVTEGDEVTMIDAGCSKEWGDLTRGLDSIGLHVDAVSGVVVTHAHSDHFGLAKQATEESIDVYVHDDEVERATGTYRGRFSAQASDLPMFRIHTLRTFFPLLRRGVMKLEFVEDVATFSDGDTLDLPGRPSVIHTPGHTEGHVMFHLEDAGALFTGDGLATMSLLNPGEGPQLMDDVFHLDADQARSSLDRIEDVDADVLLPGHGRPWRTTPAEAVAAARV